jgi:hypothetical protein
VGGPIDFNRQPLLSAGKVGDEGSNGMLPAEVQAVHSSATKAAPQDPFGCRHLLAQAACAFSGRVIAHPQSSAEGEGGRQ